MDHKQKQFQKLKELRFDNQTWTDITESDFYYHERLTFRKINKEFGKIYIDKIREAFERKEKFSFNVYGERRDFNVHGELGDDGVYRAWFSAEYKGMGNGNYYLLLNPNTAVFIEND